MYPPKFDYVAPSSLDEALSAVADHGEGAKVLAGGQSLIPLLKLRFASPDVLIDINRVPGLDAIDDSGDELIIGGLVRHDTLSEHALMKERYPVIAEAGRLIADPLVRNLGTLGGSLVHADPQADWASVMLAMNGSVVVRNKSDERTIPVDDFLHGIFETAIEPDELLTQVRVPKPKGKSGGAYHKLERKVGDFATAGVAVHVDMDDGVIASCGIGLTAMGPRNIKATDAEKVVAGQKPSSELFAEAAEAAAKVAEPRDDLRGSAEYKRAVIRTFVQRGLERSVAFAQQASA